MNIMLIPPKVAAQLAGRAIRLDNCLHIGGGIYKFAAGSMVVCLTSVDNPFGHQYRNPKEAENIRQKIAAAKKASNEATE